MILDPQRVRELTRQRTATPKQQRPAPKPGVKPDREEINQRRQHVRESHAKGESIASIARRMGISATAVRRYAGDNVPRYRYQIASIKCPVCYNLGWCEVVDTASKAGEIHRQRHCACGARFSTVETVQD